MGRSYQAEDSLRFRNGVEGYLRIELSADREPTLAGRFLYQQFVVAIRRQDLWTSSPTISLSTSTGPLALEEAGKLLVTTIDSNEQNLLDSKIAVFPYVTGETLSLESFAYYLPATHTTSLSGQALIYPIPIKGTNPKFQIIAHHPQSCVYASGELAYEQGANPSLIVKLPTCATGGTEAGFSLGFAASISHEEKTDSGATRTIGYINSPDVPLQLHQRQPIFMTQRFTVYEGDESEGKVFATTTIPSFQNLRTIAVPQAFEGGKTANGRFTIRVDWLDLSGDVAHTQRVHGVKFVTTPSFDVSKVSFVSAEGVTGLISGRASKSFKLDYPDCPPLAALGVSLDGSTYQFASCGGDGQALTIKNPSSIGADELGGTRELRLIYRDRYGNLSDPTKKPVFIDYGVPNLATQSVSLGVEFGIVSKNEASGTNDNPTNFAPGFVIRPTELSQLVLRFRSPNSCYHTTPSLADGQENTGAKIARFLAASELSTWKEEDFKACGDSLNLANRIQFPTDLTQAAKFYLKIYDGAGHGSEAFAYSIPACQGQANLHFYCWEP